MVTEEATRPPPATVSAFCSSALTSQFPPPQLGPVYIYMGFFYPFPHWIQGEGAFPEG